MDESRTATEETLTHPSSRHTLVKKISSLSYDHIDDPKGVYRGNIVSASYFWCATCRKGFLFADQFGNREFQEAVRKGIHSFVAKIEGVQTELQIAKWDR